MTEEEGNEALENLVQAAKELPLESRKNLVEEAIKTLPSEDRTDLADRFPFPTRGISDRVWLTVVRTFAFVFVASALGLLFMVAVLPLVWSLMFFLSSPGAMSADEPLLPEFPDIASYLQVLLTVVTTSAGTLAGFISGRASSGMPPS